MPENPQERAKLPGELPARVKPLYTAEDLHGFDPECDLGYPGQYPFTRGIHPTMYRSRLWTMRQYAGMGDAEESNRRYKFLLANGTAGLSVAFDLPTQIGYDSDSPWAMGEVGKAGVAIDSIEDMERLFAGIRLDTVSTSMTINATASILLALYVAVARRSGAEVSALSGTVQNDVLKEYIARGHIHLSHAACLTHCHRHVRLDQPAHAGVELHFDLRLSHARSRLDRGPGGRLHPGQRARLCSGRPRCRIGDRYFCAAVLLLF